MAVSRTSRARLRWTRPIAGAMMVGLLATHAPAVSAQPAGGDSHSESSADGVLQTLVADVTKHERRVSELELNMGGLRENANRAHVDLETARTKAERARGAVDDAKKVFDVTRDDLRGAQGTFDEMARAAMRQGYSIPSALKGARDSAEVLDRSSTLRRAAEKQGLVVDGLDRARTEAANAESTLRLARETAEKAAGEAERLHGEADRVYQEAARLLADERVAHAAAVIQRDAARAALDAARIALDAYNRSGGSSGDGRSENEVVRDAADEARDEATTEANAEANAGETTESDDRPTASARPGTTTPSTTTPTTTTPSATAPSTTAPTTTVAEPPESAESDDDAADTTTESGTGATGGDAGTSESDAGTTADTDATDGTGTNATTVQTATPANPESASPSADDRSAKIETVISRAMSQVGTPYAWGGGNANGPTKGIRDGGNADAHGDYNKVGFDCSGLTLYAYAGIGITLPHYTGYQYQRGTHYPASEMQRGDLIFYGPNGHGHVAIYLGNGQMIEAPQSGSVVRVTAVRYSGMTPNVVRLV
ncbi:NlpC/P60 family protein [Corynebacterium xerosis]|uniref:NlpC/P60 family protein n=1 Tax=Corynebacterium xerosis TaxID=1725 RepID=UPI0036725992